MTLLLAGIAITSALVGAALAWIIAQGRHVAELATSQERGRMLEQAHESLRAELAQAGRTHQQLQEQLAVLGRELATASTRLEQERNQTRQSLELVRHQAEARLASIAVRTVLTTSSDDAPGPSTAAMPSSRSLATS